MTPAKWLLSISPIVSRIKIANENRMQGKKMKSDKKQQRRAKIDW